MMTAIEHCAASRGLQQSLEYYGEHHSHIIALPTLLLSLLSFSCRPWLDLTRLSTLPDLLLPFARRHWFDLTRPVDAEQRLRARRTPVRDELWSSAAFSVISA